MGSYSKSAPRRMKTLRSLIRMMVGMALALGASPTQGSAGTIVYGTPDPLLGTQGWDVRQINADGGGNNVLFQFNPNSADIVTSLQHPTWSRDGSRIAAAGTISQTNPDPRFPPGGLALRMPLC